MKEQEENSDHHIFILTAFDAALSAGARIMEIYQETVHVDYKADDSPLTKADTEAQEIIADRFDDIDLPMLSEESEHASAEERKRWKDCVIVDPLDGTKEFIKRNGEFTVNIAHVRNGAPEAGVVFVPAIDRMYFGIRGKGAWVLDNAFHHGLHTDHHDFFTLAKPLPLQPLPEIFTIVGSRSHSSPETEAFVKEMEAKHGKVDFIAAGSSLKFCLLAEGKAHAYPRFAPTMEWDTAAGQAVLEAAGGTVVTWPDRQPLRYNREQLLNPWFLATAPK
jgi:3'(2'), 5'-bisphosphate nucleotidase